MPIVAQELLDELVDERLSYNKTHVIPIGYKYFLRRLAAENVLEITSPNGGVELRVRITPAGPILFFDGAKIAVKSGGDFSLDCDNLELKASGKMHLESGHDFNQRVAGSYQVAVRDDAKLSAQAVDIEAEQGDLSLKANDDLALDGLRVLMNVPTDKELQQKRDEITSFKEFLERPFHDGQGGSDGRMSARLPQTQPKARDDW